VSPSAMALGYGWQLLARTDELVGDAGLALQPEQPQSNRPADRRQPTLSRPRMTTIHLPAAGRLLLQRPSRHSSSPARISSSVRSGKGPRPLPRRPGGHHIRTVNKPSTTLKGPSRRPQSPQRSLYVPSL
jgi:hypothetical protein